MRKQITKKLLLLLVLALAGLFFMGGKTALAANPTTMNFQGKVVNANGTNVANNTYSFIFRIYNTASPVTTTTCTSTASCLWEETQASVTVSNGVFQVELGASCALTSSSCNNSTGGPINWSTTSSLYLTMQFAGDAAGFMSPTIHLTSVPFAFNADNAAHLDAGTANGALGVGDVNAGVITLGNVTNSSFLFRTKNAASAFQVQNATSGNLLNVDSLLSNITLLGNNDPQTSAWTSQGSNLLPASVTEAGAVLWNGFVYVIGGNNGGTWQQIYYAQLNADGSTGAWTTQDPIIPGGGIKDAVTVAANGYVYIIGGTGNSTAISNSYYAKFNPDGSVGAFKETTQLPAARKFATGVVANGYVYVAGGISGAGSATTSVYSAKLNADGSLGGWSTLNQSLPVAREEATSVIANGYMYVIGGSNGGGTQTVFYAALNADGTTGAWTNQGNVLPAARLAATSVVANGYVYVFGGSATTSVYYAKLNSGGATGTWTSQAGNLLPAARSNAVSVTANGYVYVISGSANTIYYASLSRLKIGAANIDLVGLQGLDIASSGDFSQGSVAGTITAGNITGIGSLQINGQANFSDNVGIGGGLSVVGTATIRPSSDATSGFQVADKLGNAMLNVNTTTNDNLVADGNFEGSAVTSPWAALNGSTLSVVSTAKQFGAQSLQAVLNAANADDGAKYTYNFRPNTSYILSVYAAITSGSTTTFQMGTVQNAGGQTQCGVTNTTLTATLTKYTCTFTTGSTTTPSDFFYFKRVTAAAGTLVFDGVKLEYGGKASASPYSDPGLSLTNLVNYPSFENSNTNGWSLHLGGAPQSGNSIAPSTDFALFGSYSLKVVTGTSTTTGGNGVEFRYPFAPNTQYSLGFWARRDTSSATAFAVGRNDNPATLGTSTGDSDCTTNPVIGTSGLDTTWKQYNCTFTTGSTIGASSNFYIKQTDTTPSDTIYIDGVTLVQSPVGLSFTPVASGVEFNNQTLNLILNGSGSGELQPWRLNNIPVGATSATGTAVNREQAATVGANGFIYVIGGTTDGTTATNTVYYAKLNTDGSVQGWTAAANTLPAVIRYAGAAVANGYLYVIGGANSSAAAQTTIWYSKLSSDGSPGTWQTNAVVLPAAKIAPAVSVVNGIIYILGGCSALSDTPVCGANSLTANYYGKLNANGSIQGVTASSTLSTATAFANGRGMGQTVFANGSIYYVGGSGSEATAGPKATVLSATVNSDGTLAGSWTSQTSLPANRTQPSVVLANGFLYAIGGCTSITASTAGSCASGSAASTVYYSTLNGDGTIGNWFAAGNPLPSARSAATGFVANSYVYILGGLDGGAARTSTAYYASTPRTLVGGGLDLVGINSQGLADYGGGGTLTAGTIRAVGDLKVDGYADFNNGISVDSALSINAVSGSLGQTIFNINNSNSNSIFSIQHMNTNFGSLVKAGAFEGRSSYWGEEFNNGHATNCGGTFTVAGGDINGYARGDYGNPGTTTACTVNNTNTANVGGGELNASFANGAAAGSCTLASQNVVNGVERITATSSATASSTANCVENLGATATTSNKIVAAANLPVIAMKVKPSTLSVGALARIQVGVLPQDSAAGLGNNSPANAIYFTSCSNWVNAGVPTGCNNTTWYGVSSGATTATVVTCTGTLSTTQFAYLRIEVRSTTDIHFFADVDSSNGINETECGTGVSATATASALTPWMQAMYMTNTATTTALDIDYFRVWQDDNVPPPPESAEIMPNGEQVLADPPLVVESASTEDPSAFFSFNAATSEDTVFNKDVYVKGTLFADKIKANQIEGLQVLTDQLASLQQKVSGDSASVGSSANPNSATLSDLLIRSATISMNLNANGGLTVGGDARFNGNAFFYKLVTFVDKTVFKGDVTFAAHITTDGNTPTATLENGAGDITAAINLAVAKVGGNDNSGQLTVDIGDNATAGKLVTLSFEKPFSKAPRVLITPANGATAQIRYYVTATSTDFAIMVVDAPIGGSTLTFNYWVVQ